MKSLINLYYNFPTKTKQHIKTEVTGFINNKIKKRRELESMVAVLQQHFKKYQKWISKLKSDNEELNNTVVDYA